MAFSHKSYTSTSQLRYLRVVRLSGVVILLHYWLEMENFVFKRQT